MKLSYPVLVLPLMKVNGMALFPVILLQREAAKHDAVIIRHETIHLRQQAEMLILPFYFFYLVNYLINRFKYKTHDAAYRNIVFEREAYGNDSNSNYLQIRKTYAWLKYFKPMA